MYKLQVFDPAMCCSTGVCGPNPDPVLPRFAADLQWLSNQGITVERFNLAQQPQAFASNPIVKSALAQYGNDCLPLILVDGAIASRGSYPTRQELATLAGLSNGKAPSLYRKRWASWLQSAHRLRQIASPVSSFTSTRRASSGSLSRTWLAPLIPRRW